MSVHVARLPGQTYVTTSAVRPGALCQSLAHGIYDPVPGATVDASIAITLDVVAQVYLCPECASTLPDSSAATDSAGG